MTDPRCRAGEDCTARTSDGAALTHQANTICHSCITDIQKCLDQLPHLAAALTTMKGSWGSVSYEARVTGSKEPPSPLHVGVVDLIDEIWDRIDDAEGYRIVDLVTRPAQEWVFCGRKVVRDGVDRALHIRWVHTKAANRVGFDKVWQRRAAACPNCQLPTLGSWVGEEQILCTNEDCLASFTRSEYENHCINSARNEKGKK